MVSEAQVRKFIVNQEKYPAGLGITVSTNKPAKLAFVYKNKPPVPIPGETGTSLGQQLTGIKDLMQTVVKVAKETEISPRREIPADPKDPNSKATIIPAKNALSALKHIHIATDGKTVFNTANAPSGMYEPKFHSDRLIYEIDTPSEPQKRVDYFDTIAGEQWLKRSPYHLNIGSLSSVADASFKQVVNADSALASSKENIKSFHIDDNGLAKLRATKLAYEKQTRQTSPYSIALVDIGNSLQVVCGARSFDASRNHSNNLIDLKDDTETNPAVYTTIGDIRQLALDNYRRPGASYNLSPIEIFGNNDRAEPWAPGLVGLVTKFRELDSSGKLFGEAGGIADALDMDSQFDVDTSKLITLTEKTISLDFIIEQAKQEDSLANALLKNYMIRLAKFLGSQPAIKGRLKLFITGVPAKIYSAAPDKLKKVFLENLGIERNDEDVFFYNYQQDMNGIIELLNARAAT